MVDVLDGWDKQRVLKNDLVELGQRLLVRLESLSHVLSLASHDWFSEPMFALAKYVAIWLHFSKVNLLSSFAILVTRLAVISTLGVDCFV